MLRTGKKKMKRQYIRALRMVAVYEDLVGIDVSIPSDIRTEEITDDELLSLTEPIIKKRGDLENMISQNLDKLSIDRLALVDRAILVVGLYESLYEGLAKDIVINEAINLAYTFSETKFHQARGLINAVLDRAIKND